MDGKKTEISLKFQLQKPITNLNNKLKQILLISMANNLREHFSLDMIKKIYMLLISMIISLNQEIITQNTKIKQS
jgi:hypothetical protein